MEASIIFIYDKKPFKIQCKKNDDMNTNYKQLVEKINIDINDFDFFYGDKKIINNATFSQLNNDLTNEIIVLIEKKLKIVKCPKCICNDTIIKIKNYKISFSNCKFCKISEEYDNSQKIDFSQIV